MTYPDLTPPEHCNNAAVEEAARFLLTARDHGPEVIPLSDLMTRFGLTPDEAQEAGALARQWSDETPRGRA